MARVQSIVIVGAGPAGLMLALLLAKSGIPNLRIRLLEREASPTNETRAVFFMPVSHFEFERAGILDDVKAAAFIPRSAAFRDQTDPQKLLFELPNRDIIALTSDKLTAIAEKHLAQQMGADAMVLWSHKAVGAGQNSGKAWIDYESPEGKGRLEADYVVGCDGGGSLVRRALLGEKALVGFTWEDQLVAVDLHYDLYSYGMSDSNLMMHPRDAWLAFRPSWDESFWRIVYADEGGLSPEQLILRHPQKLQQLLPGSPRPEQYEVVSVQPYKIHQRIVDKMRIGRFLLASDAAHLCTPNGAYGLNGGIADVGSLRDCLVAMANGNADDNILDIYNDVRRDKWNTIINPRSQGMKKFIFSDPKVVLPGHPMYQMAMQMKESPEKLPPSLPDLSLRYDFSKHFKDGKKPEEQPEL